MRKFKSVRFGFDFFLDNRNTFTVTQNIVEGRFSNKEEQDQEYFNSAKILERTGDRFSMVTTVSTGADHSLFLHTSLLKPASS
jgi:hypothetical protein